MAEEQQDAMKLHDLRPAKGSNKPKLRYGRGESGQGGKTATRGTKGTRARNTVPAGFEGGQLPLHMRLPKLRGFRNPATVEFQGGNLEKPTEALTAGGSATVAELVEKGLVRKNQPVKVLGSGDISVAINITADAFSKSAVEKIAAAGGTTTTA